MRSEPAPARGRALVRRARSMLPRPVGAQGRNRPRVPALCRQATRCRQSSSSSRRANRGRRATFPSNPGRLPRARPAPARAPPSAAPDKTCGNDRPRYRARGCTAPRTAIRRSWPARRRLPAAARCRAPGTG